MGGGGGNFLSFFKKKRGVFYTALESLNNRVRKLFGGGWTDFWEGVGGKLYDAFNPPTTTHISAAGGTHGGGGGLPRYANGGFPAQGEIFIAREAGPELVGRIGSSTAVANNEQIIQGIKQAVLEAMTIANASNNERPIYLNATIEVDDREIGRAAAKYQNGQQIKSNRKG